MLEMVNLRVVSAYGKLFGPRSSTSVLPVPSEIDNAHRVVGCRVEFPYSESPRGFATLPPRMSQPLAPTDPQVVRARLAVRGSLTRRRARMP